MKTEINLLTVCQILPLLTVVESAHRSVVSVQMSSHQETTAIPAGVFQMHRTSTEA